MRDDGVEEFGGGGDAHFSEAQEQAAGLFQAELDVVTVVKMRIVDQALPADGGARFLEIDAHDDFEAVAQFLPDDVELFRVLEGGGDVVDGAGADHGEQARVLLFEYLTDGGAAIRDGGGGGFRHGKFGFDGPRGGEADDALDMEILNGSHGKNSLTPTK